MGKNNIKQQNIAISAGLNIIRKACMVAFPLVTYSYATRVLGRAGIGIHEFAQSIVSYFALIAALGITQYAVRDGGAMLADHMSKRGQDSFAKERTALDDFASEVFSINLCMTVVAYILMGLCIAFVPFLKGYGTAIWIASSLILFTTLGVDWINSLFEDYLYLTLRYIVVSVIALGLLLIFVKSPEDVYKYIFIANFATIANGIMNIIYIRRHIKLKFTFSLNLAKHGLPIFTLFCNNISSVVYLNSDVTILGILMDDESVGLYGMSAKVYMMLKDLVNAAIFVTIPRFSMYVADGAECTREKYKEGLSNLLTPLLAFVLPAGAGLYMMASNVIFMIAGEKFLDGSGSLRILSLAMFFAVMACFLAYAIVLPNKLEKYFLMATTIAAIVNIVLNFIMIPRIGIEAAAWTTLIAEILVFSILLFVSGKKVAISELIKAKDLVLTVIGSILVVAVCAIANIIALGIYGARTSGLSESVTIKMPAETIGQCILVTGITVLLAVVVYAGLLGLCGHSTLKLIGMKLKTGRK